MNLRAFSSLLATFVLAAGATAQEPAPSPAADPGSAPGPALELAELRGAGAATAEMLGESERSDLAGAERMAPELEVLAGHDINLSDRDVRLILITVGVVIILAILL